MIAKSMLTMDGLHSAMVEASCLGLGPGHWPVAMAADPDVGNGQPFLRRHAETTPEGEITGVHYHQLSGMMQILVIND